VSFNWSDYLALAVQLHTVPLISQEASDRTAISRAYYAAFNLTADRLGTKGEWRRAHGPQDHKELADLVKRYGRTTKGRVGHTLERLYYNRCKADYDGDIEQPSKLAEASILMAKEITASLPPI